MSIQGRFSHVMREALRQSDRVARMRDAKLTSRRVAGSTATPATFPGSVNYYGRWGVTSWGDFRWR